MKDQQIKKTYLKSRNVCKVTFRVLKEAVPDAHQVCVAGDFNESESKGAIQSLFDREMTDALSLYDKKSKTWFWRLMPGVNLSNRYDHIIFNKYLSCTGACVTRVQASDHMPVLAVFEKGKI